MAEGLAKTLPGTHQAALDFRNWLMADQGVAPADIYFCAEDETLPGRTASAKRNDIVEELERLKNDGKDKTDELYFLFIGHGLCYKDVDGVRLADIMLAADYKKRSNSGNACLKIDEIQKWLRLCMGPSDHFYFIDACRNDTSERDIKVGSLGLTYDNSWLGIPTVYTLYSTVEGAVAVAKSDFVKLLITALKGVGRAKVWRGADMAVFFRSVKDYVEKKLTGQAIDERKEGSRDGLIREIAPPPAFKCEVVVQNAAPTDLFTLTVRDARGSPVATMQFAGPNGSFTRVPDDYNLQLTSPAASVDPLDPLPADLYDNCKVRFVKRAPMKGPLLGTPPAGGPVDVTVHAPAWAKIILRHLDRDETVEGTGTFSEWLTPGRYLVKTVDERRGVTIRRQTVEVAGAQRLQLDLRKFDSSPLRDALLGGIPGAHYGGAVDMSESLGPTPDQGLDLWLAVIGASRIVGGPGDFSKLGPLPLASFADTALNDSQLYLLAGFDEAQTRLAVGLSAGPEVTLQPLQSHRSFPGLFEFTSRAPPGYRLISVQIDEKAPVSVGACTLPNRATLITLTTDDDGGLCVQQFILPIKHLADRLSPQEQAYFVETPLRSVQRMVEIQRQFARSEELRSLLSLKELDQLLHLKWFEPIVAVLAAYELARRGELQYLREVVGNLRSFFAEIPDTEAIAKMAGPDWHMPAHPPLVLDGFLSLNMPSELLPLDSETLDFRGPWTEWKGAVSAPETLRRPAPG
jgi:hypothetical protein